VSCTRLSLCGWKSLLWLLASDIDRATVLEVNGSISEGGCGDVGCGVC